MDGFPKENRCLIIAYDAGLKMKPIMRILRIWRSESTTLGTRGELLGLGKKIVTLERSWRNNANEESGTPSCIPCGVYTCERRKEASPKFKRKLYEVKDVPDRSEILFHGGNWAGDGDAGYLYNATGCILLGFTIGEIYDKKTKKSQDGIGQSQSALNYFMKELNGEPFCLEICWEKGKVYKDMCLCQKNINTYNQFIQYLETNDSSVIRNESRYHMNCPMLPYSQTSHKLKISIIPSIICTPAQYFPEISNHT